MHKEHTTSQNDSHKPIVCDKFTLTTPTEKVLAKVIGVLEKQVENRNKQIAKLIKELAYCAYCPLSIASQCSCDLTDEICHKRLERWSKQ